MAWQFDDAGTMSQSLTRRWLGRALVFACTALVAASFGRALKGWDRPGAPSIPARSATARYTITEIPSLGGRFSAAWDVSDRGEVVGEASAAEGKLHAFLWREGQMTDLGVLPGYQESGAAAVSNSGAVAGALVALKGERVERYRAFLYQAGRMRELGALPGHSFSAALGVNEKGDVAGYSVTGRVARAFLYAGGRMRDLGTIGGAGSLAEGINGKGQVVGSSTIDSGGRQAHAFLHDGRRMRDLGTLGGRNSGAAAINERGQVTGASERRDGAAHAFLWEQGRMRDLGSVPGYSWSIAADLNDGGQVVGILLEPEG